MQQGSSGLARIDRSLRLSSGSSNLAASLTLSDSRALSTLLTTGLGPFRAKPVPITISPGGAWVDGEEGKRGYLPLKANDRALAKSSFQMVSQLQGRDGPEPKEGSWHRLWYQTGPWADPRTHVPDQESGREGGDSN